MARYAKKIRMHHPLTSFRQEVNNITMNLKQIRQKQGITQAEMAEKLGVSRPTYIQIERGQRELTVGQAKVIAELLQAHKSQELEPKKLKKETASERQSGKFNHQKF